MSLPLVSVLMPAYNHEQYVKSTIQSIIMQDYPDIELIIIDDGSKDDTLKIIQEMSHECTERFKRFDVETQENQGTCVTWNRLRAKASGEYVLLIASDDELLPGAITAMVSKLESMPEAGLVVGRNLIMDSEGKTCFWDDKLNNVYKQELAKHLSFSDLLDTGPYPSSHPKWGTYEALAIYNHIPNGYIIRKSILDKIPPFTKDAPLEDWWLMLQLAKYSKLVNIAQATFRYRWHATNSIKQTEKMQQYAQKTEEWEKKYISGLNDKTWARLFRSSKRKARIAGWIAGITRFIFQKKKSKSRRTIIKLFKVPIYISRKQK